MDRKLRVVCIKEFYYNITKPYFKFENGTVYDAIVYHDSILANSPYFGFEFCSYISIERDFYKNFKSLEELRDQKLEKILE